MAACGRVEFGPHFPNCVLLLEMEDDRFMDSCGGNMVELTIGSPMSVPTGSRGRGAFFGGADCLLISDSPQLDATTAVSISAWIHPTDLSVPEAKGIVSKRTDINVETAYALFVWTGDRIFVDLNDLADRQPSSGAVVTDRWQLLTVVYDGLRSPEARVRLYVDGVLDGVLYERSEAIAPYPSPLFVGCQPTTTMGDEFFTGYMDDIAIWRYALDDDDVRGWYESTRP